jgi:NADPH-dependent glutamate synthase beta subunit-like oxidoreductase
MNAFSPVLTPEPYPGYDAEIALRFAVSCLQCEPPAPCTQACPQGADVPALMRWVGQAGCAGFSLRRWAQAQEEAAERAVVSDISDSYN